MMEDNDRSTIKKIAIYAFLLTSFIGFASKVVILGNFINATLVLGMPFIPVIAGYISFIITRANQTYKRKGGAEIGSISGIVIGSIIGFSYSLSVSLVGIFDITVTALKMGNEIILPDSMLQQLLGHIIFEISFTFIFMIASIIGGLVANAYTKSQNKSKK